MEVCSLKPWGQLLVQLTEVDTRLLRIGCQRRNGKMLLSPLVIDTFIRNEKKAIRENVPFLEVKHPLLLV